MTKTNVCSIISAVIMVIIMAIISSQVSCHCPAGEPLAPCTCELIEYEHLPRITCAVVNGAQLKEVFTKLEHLDDGEKHFHYLTLTGVHLDQLLELTFDDITIDHIVIEDAPNLSKIDTNAFKNTHFVLESLVLRNLPALDVSNLFDILNKLRSIEMIVLNNTAELEEIPTEAFKTLKKLRYLAIMGPNIKKINERAFFNLNSLSFLEIIQTSLDKIGENIFVFSRESTHFLTIALFHNKLLNCDSFSPGTFSKIGRPVSLDFTGYHYVSMHDRKQFTCMPEEVFRPFLAANENNDVDLYEIDFDCNNCKNAWLKKATEFHERLMSIQCEGGNELLDASNFNSC